MALFDIFTDLFTGDPAHEAAQKQRDFLSNTTNQIIGRLGEAQTGGLEALRSAQESGIGAIVPAFQQGRGDILTGLGGANEVLFGPSGFFNPAEDVYSAYTNAAANALAQAQPEAIKALYEGTDLAAKAFDPLLGAGREFGDYYRRSSQAEEDALGLNGPEGIARSREAFRTRPAYDFTVNEAIKAATRGANVGGMVAGGNMLQELTDRASSLADLEWDDYMNRLTGRQQLYAPLSASALGQAGAGQSQAYLTRGTGAANIFQNTGSRLADLYSTMGRGLADMYSSTGRTGAELASRAGGSLADLASRSGVAQADIFGKTGTNIANLLAEIARAQSSAQGQLAGPFANTFATDASADLWGSKNLLGLLGSGLNFLASPGFGTLTSNLSGLFK